MRRIWTRVGLALALGACSPGEKAEPQLDDAAVIASGKRVYENVCLICHAADPRERGSLGPPIAGAALPLLEAKVLRGEYPPGYQPVQPGATMPKFEFVEPKLADVAAYLASFEDE